MPIELHPQALEKIVPAVASGLAEAVVDHGIFFRRASLELEAAERTLPQNGAVREKLIKYIDEHALVQFIFGSISRELYDQNAFEMEGSKRLVDIPGFNDPTSVAQRLITQLQALPDGYTYSVRLPSEFDSALADFRNGFVLSKKMRVIPGWALNGTFPLEAEEVHQARIWGSSILGAAKPERWDGSYLQIQERGFVGTFVSTAPSERAESLVKAFFGALVALRAMRPKYSTALSPVQRRVVIHRWSERAWELYEALQLDADASKTISDLAIDDLNGTMDESDKKRDWLRSNLANLHTLFSNEGRAQRVILACRWLFDSYSTANELLSFVQAMVVLEILLGDKARSDLMGLGELLANRCAYLIGSTYSQREEILSNFAKSYDVRSQIVHRGKSKLRRSELAMLHELRWMCGRVIQEEIKLLGKEPALAESIVDD